MPISLLDWKSSTGVWDEMRTQVSAYTMMAREYDIEKTGILRLDKETGMLDDPPVVIISKEEIYIRWAAFLHLREYYRLLLEPTAKQDRWYPHNDKKFPTITTINDVLNKPALPQWAANMTIEYIRGNRKELTTDEQWEYHLKKAKTAYRTIGKKAMDTGSIVHDAIHAYLSGAKPEPILEGNDKATNGFLAFLEANKKLRLKPLALEKVLIDPRHEIGGTTDFIGFAEI